MNGTIIRYGEPSSSADVAHHLHDTRRYAPHSPPDPKKVELQCQALFAEACHYGGPAVGVMNGVRPPAVKRRKR